MEFLEKNLHDYFTYTISFIKDWSICILVTKDVFKALKNQSEQLECVYSCSWDQTLKKFPDIKERLIHKIQSGLEEESSRLNDTWCKLSSLKNELQSKLDYIERNVRNQCLANYTSYGITVPPIYKVIEYAEDIMMYYNAVFIQMTYALKSMDFKSQKTIIDLERIFWKSAIVPNNIKDILSITKPMISVPFTLDQFDIT